MKKMDHAHVDAAVLSLLLVGIVAVVDIWVDLVDRDPRKIIYYFVAFAVMYTAARFVFKKLWLRKN